jgi:hypothetical protein
MTTIHVRYEILDDPSTAHPESPQDAYLWGVRAVGLPGKLNVYGVGDTLDEALVDLSEGVRGTTAALATWREERAIGRG